MKLERLDPYDDNGIAEVVALHTAAQAADHPGMFPEPAPRGLAARLRLGPVADRDQRWLLRSTDRSVVGELSVRLPQRDNTHQASMDVTVHPEHRRQGHGTRLIEEGLRIAREASRRTAISFVLERPGPRAFAERLGFSLASVSVLRRQDLTELDRAELARLRAYAAEKADGYSLLRLFGPVPDELVDDVARMASAINDAPRAALDSEDTVIDAERIRLGERHLAASGQRVYHVIARHSSGWLAGHTVVEVDSFRPEWGEQGDTAVVREHRGHRLGLLLKADMLTWLAGEEPALRYLTTGNDETNQHMIAINEQLGYRVLSRLLIWQRGLENE